jgi:hypothetical protein
LNLGRIENDEVGANNSASTRPVAPDTTEGRSGALAPLNQVMSAATLFKRGACTSWREEYVGIGADDSASTKSVASATTEGVSGAYALNCVMSAASATTEGGSGALALDRAMSAATLLTRGACTSWREENTGIGAKYFASTKPRASATTEGGSGA